MHHGRDSRLMCRTFFHLEVRNTFELVDFSFIHPTINEHAHALPKLCFAMDEKFVWTGVSLNWCVLSVHKLLL